MGYVVEMLINGKWKVWNKYETSAMGYSAKERAELGLKTARQYGESRLVEIKDRVESTSTRGAGSTKTSAS